VKPFGIQCFSIIFTEVKMNKRILLVFCFFIGVILAAAPVAMAKVTAEEAATLKTTLTPFGAERAGNEAGTIPAWDGGMTTPPAGYQGPGSRYVDPYEGDKILFSINAGNMDQYADQLNAGLKALLKKYPDTFRIDVYPSHRPHAMPEYVYENTYKNALQAELSEDELNPKGAYGGIPFPIPKSGAEVHWNHTCRYQSQAKVYSYSAYLIQPDGQVVLSSGSRVNEQWPYYYKEGSAETFKGDFWYFSSQYLLPARRKGELLLVRDPLNESQENRRAWQYLTGQRRVRMAPTVAHDTPNPAFSGTVAYDQSNIFNGSMEKYDWKLVGKKEMIIPYNTYRSMAKVAPTTKYKKGHISPEYLRFELHRVWVVEATVKPGARQSYAKRVIQYDEDSWAAITQDVYDARGNLWRTDLLPSAHAYEIPGVQIFMNLHFDLPSGISSVNYDYSDYDNMPIFDQREDESYFLPDQMRRMGQ
jgi:hypothetical protein